MRPVLDQPPSREQPRHGRLAESSRPVPPGRSGGSARPSRSSRAGRRTARCTAASTSAAVPARCLEAYPCAAMARRRTAARETFAAAIPMFYTGTTDRPVTLRAMRRFLLWCAIVLAAAYAVGVPLFLLARRRCPPRGRGRRRRARRARQPAAGRADARRRRDRADARGLGDPQRSRRSARAVSAARSRRTSSASIPGPFSTPGEAQAISALAEARGWDTVVLVTPDYERLVAERVFRRCGDFGSPSTASTSRGGATWSGSRSSG